MSFKKVLLVISLLKFTLNCISQSSTIIILDSISLNRIPSVSIKIDKINYSSNNKGEFLFNRKGIAELEISCIGYEKRIITQLNNIDTILLKPRSYHLKEVPINYNHSKKSYPIGYHNLSHVLTYTFGGPINSYVASFIPYNGENTTIEKVIIKLKNASRNYKFKIFLFEVNKEGKPGRTIYSEDINYAQTHPKGTIDISKNKIEMPKSGIFVGYQWLYQKNINSDISNKVRIKVTHKADSNYSYFMIPSKFQFSSHWVKLKSGDEDSATYNPRFGLELRPY